MKRVLINRLHIDKVRHLRNIHISLEGEDGAIRHLILTGKNGSGKTSVLDALAGAIDSICWGQCPSQIELDLKDCVKRLEYWCSDPERNKERLRQDISNRDSLASRLEAARHGLRVTFNMDDTDVHELYESGDCVFAHFGAKRSFEAVVPTSIEKITFADRYGVDDSPRGLFVKYLLDLKMTQALAATGGKRERADEIQRWFDRLRDILRDIYEDPTLDIEFDEETYRFSICEQGREPFGFNEASDGFSALLDIVVGLILRMVKKRGRATTFDLPGIVLIDEVESHLHLSLQKKALPTLTNLFPNVQFVVTTHSPFVLSSMDSAVVYDLESGTLVKDGLGQSTYESIVEGYFNVDSLSKDLRERFERYKELAAKDELGDRVLLEASELELYLDEIPDYLALGVTTEYQRLKTELHSKVVGR